MKLDIKIWAFSIVLLSSCAAPEPQLTPQELAEREERFRIRDEWGASYYQWLVKREFSDVGPPPPPPPQVTGYQQSSCIRIANLQFRLEYGRDPRPMGGF